MMDWTYPAETGDAGIFEIGRRLAEALGRAPDATRFTYDARGMMRTTREIERASAGGRLLVGFQTAAKFSVEIPRYQGLEAAGTEITVWAHGGRPAADDLERLDYRAIPADALRLANQWFLVTDRPERLAFVSYELGDPATFGIGGAGSPGKRFVGFVSDDPGVVDLLLSALLPVGAPPPPPPEVRPSPAAADIIKALDAAADTSPSGAVNGAIVVPVGRGSDRDAFIAALHLARREGRSLVVVDRSAEGFASPYSDMRGDDEGRPTPDALFDALLARREGRGTLATFLEAAAAVGVAAGGWFPTRSGAEGLAEAGRRFGGAVLMLPPDSVQPSLAERLRGMVPDRLAVVAGLTVIVAARS